MHASQHASPHLFPAHEKACGGQVKVPAVTHCSCASHAVAANVGTGQRDGSVPSGQTPHESPHCFPTQPHDGGGGAGGGEHCGGWLPATQEPATSQNPASDGIMHGGVALRQGGSMVHASPHALPAHASCAGEQIGPGTEAETHR
jgi:hypothetical protein